MIVLSEKDKQLLKFTKKFMMHMNFFKGVSVKRVKIDGDKFILLKLSFRVFDRGDRTYIEKFHKIHYYIKLKITKNGVELSYEPVDKSTRSSKVSKFFASLEKRAKKLQGTVFKNSGRAFDKWVLFPAEYAKFNLNSIER